MKKTEDQVATRPAVETTAKPRGRPLSFCRETVLEKAMHVFWERGYESSSISDLTAAMGITPPSLYAAFGDKEHLFLEAVERYAMGPAGGVLGGLETHPTARSAIQGFLECGAKVLTEPDHPRGCMVVMAATNCSIAAERVQAALAKRRAAGEVEMTSRIQRGIDDGELPPETDAAALANFYATVYQGMSMQAKDGATFENLMATAAAAMRAWPVAQARQKAPARTSKASA